MMRVYNLQPKVIHNNGQFTYEGILYTNKCFFISLAHGLNQYLEQLGFSCHPYDIMKLISPNIGRNELFDVWIKDLDENPFENLTKLHEELKIKIYFQNTTYSNNIVNHVATFGNNNGYMVVRILEYLGGIHFEFINGFDRVESIVHNEKRAFNLARQFEILRKIEIHDAKIAHELHRKEKQLIDDKLLAVELQSKDYQIQNDEMFAFNTEYSVVSYF